MNWLRKVQIYTCVLLGFAIIMASCMQENLDSEAQYLELSGSILRNVAGMPDSISKELLATSDYSHRIEAAIATCMRSNGFEYFPEENELKQQIDKLGFDLPPGDFARDFGFGIFNGTILGMNSRNSLNNEYVLSLNPEEIESYRITLNGTDVLMQSGSDVLEVGGCRRHALEIVEQPSWYTNQDWLADVSSQLFQRLSSDPRIIDIERQWMSCMAGLGYDDWTNEEELNNSLNNEFIELFQTLIPTQRFDDGEEFLKALDEESRTALDAFRSKEIELAVASHECSSEHDDSVLSISKEIEESIILSNPIN